MFSVYQLLIYLMKNSGSPVEIIIMSELDFYFQEKILKLNLFLLNLILAMQFDF